MEYPKQWHEITEETEYYVHGYMGIVATCKTIKEAREKYHKEKADYGQAMITRKTTQTVVMETYTHIQGTI